MSTFVGLSGIKMGMRVFDSFERILPLSSRTGRRIALGKRLRGCPSFDCVGIESNWEDYPPEIREAIQEADKIYYPTPLYNDLFDSIGKEIFPRNSCHFLANKIRQTLLFQLADISHPLTRVYYGRNPRERIRKDFSFPFIAKTPVGSSQGLGVFLIQGEQDLLIYLQNHRPAYIQEVLPIDRDLRVVLFAGKVVHAYWRIHAEGDFRNNVAQGGRVSFEDIPEEALDFARDVACRCRFDDVGMDVCQANGTWYVLEANMVFGMEGFRLAGLDFLSELARMDREGLF